MPDLSRDRIVECALALVREGGDAALGLRPLARQLGVTAPALYGYVDSLDELIRVLAETQFEELDRRLAKFQRRKPRQKVRAQCRAYIDYALEEPELFKLLFKLPPRLPGSGIDVELPIATKVFTAAAESITDGMTAGEFRRQDPLIAALTVWTVAHGCATVLNLGFDFDDHTREQLISSALDTLIAGLE